MVVDVIVVEVVWDFVFVFVYGTVRQTHCSLDCRHDWALLALLFLWGFGFGWWHWVALL